MVGPEALPFWRASPISARLLILVDAPAGYGKSTLIAQWKLLGQRPFAWVSLDVADNDPVSFWTYVVAAITEALPSVGTGLETLIRSQGGLRNRLIPRLLNRLCEEQADLVLVLDDYHLIRDPKCHELVSFLMENLPESSQLVIVTRADPPLNVAKLRVENRLFEVRGEQLRFMPREAEELFKNVLGWSPLTPQVKDLWARTEGWPAGLSLAAMSLGDQSDVQAFVDGFAGDNRILADYLTDEVLGRQTPEVRRFLIRTSILERFTPDLAAEVVGEKDDPGVLLSLERANLFVLPMDEKREWYRYHPLFRQLLFSDLERSEFDLIPELHQRAVDWYQRHGYSDWAVDHAISSWERRDGPRLIWGTFLAYMNAGRFQTLARWLTCPGARDGGIRSDPQSRRRLVGRGPRTIERNGGVVGARRSCSRRYADARWGGDRGDGDRSPQRDVRTGRRLGITRICSNGRRRGGRPDGSLACRGSLLPRLPVACERILRRSDGATRGSEEFESPRPGRGRSCIPVGAVSARGRCW